MNFFTHSLLLFTASFLYLPACEAVSKAGASAPPLRVAKLYSIPTDRIKFEDGEPTDKYDFSAARGDLDSDTFSSIVQTVLPPALGVRITEETMSQTALVLKLRAEPLKTLQRADSTEASYITFKDGKLLISNSSLKQIAEVLEGHLKVVVIDKTGLEGRYDAELDIPFDDENGIATAFGKAFGIDLPQEFADVRVLRVHHSVASNDVEAKP